MAATFVTARALEEPVLAFVLVAIEVVVAVVGVRLGVGEFLDTTAKAELRAIDFALAAEVAHHLVIDLPAAHADRRDDERAFLEADIADSCTGVHGLAAGTDAGVGNRRRRGLLANKGREAQNKTKDLHGIVLYRRSRFTL